MEMTEAFRIVVLVLFMVLAVTYPFGVMGPGRPRHTWWAVVMGECFCLSAAFIMIDNLDKPLQLKYDLIFLIGALTGLYFVYNSFKIYRPFRR